MIISAIFVSFLMQLSFTQWNPILKNENCSNEMLYETNIMHRKPIYWIYDTNYRNNSKFLHVKNVLEAFGYEEGTNESDWDFLWSHTYPFNFLREYMIDLKPHQRVNHISDLTSLTKKVVLSSSKNKYMPKSFRMPHDERKLQKYARKHPDKMFVQKHTLHRHIEIKMLNEIDFQNEDFFVQEFIEKPLLVDGHKFDIGVYIVITSIDPLRVYTYQGDALLRYCPEKYYPFDKNNKNQYIVRENHKQSWEIDELRPFHKSLGFNSKGSFNGYMASKGLNPNVIWDQIDEILRYTMYENEPALIKNVRFSHVNCFNA